MPTIPDNVKKALDDFRAKDDAVRSAVDGYNKSAQELLTLAQALPIVGSYAKILAAGASGITALVDVQDDAVDKLDDALKST